MISMDQTPEFRTALRPKCKLHRRLHWGRSCWLGQLITQCNQAPPLSTDSDPTAAFQGAKGEVK